MTEYISRADAICEVLVNDGIDNIVDRINALPSADAVQIPIKLEKRYPESKDEDITDAFMRGYLAGRSSADAVYGKWLPIEETIPTYYGGEKTWITGMKCSNCGKLHDLRVGYYYCPTCGARMIGGDDE